MVFSKFSSDEAEEQLPTLAFVISFRIAQPWLDLWLLRGRLNLDYLQKYLWCVYESRQLQPSAPTSFFYLNSLPSYAEFEKEVSIHCNSVSTKKFLVRGHSPSNVFALLSSSAFRHMEYASFKELASFP